MCAVVFMMHYNDFEARSSYCNTLSQ